MVSTLFSFCTPRQRTALRALEHVRAHMAMFTEYSKRRTEAALGVGSDGASDVAEKDERGTEYQDEEERYSCPVLVLE